MGFTGIYLVSMDFLKFDLTQPDEFLPTCTQS